MACPWRAAGRYRWQYDGAHRCEPPLITRRSCSVNVAVAGPQQECVGVSVVAPAWFGVQGELVHSQTFPTTSNSPKPLGAKCFTGVVRSAPGAARLWYGNRPCQVLALTFPRGMNSSPHG